MEDSESNDFRESVNDAPVVSDERKPWMSSGRSMYRYPSERLPMDLFSYTRESIHCFDQARYLAAITMASSAVELILNRDGRLRYLREMRRSRDGWACLNNRNLRIARKYGLPTSRLLSDDDDVDGHKPIAFVELRNKVAHGEITHLVNTLSDYDPVARKLAAGQEMKMRNFVGEWFNTAPDVQEGRIKAHRWPD